MGQRNEQNLKLKLWDSLTLRNIGVRVLAFDLRLRARLSHSSQSIACSPSSMPLKNRNSFTVFRRFLALHEQKSRFHLAHFNTNFCARYDNFLWWNLTKILDRCSRGLPFMYSLLLFTLAPGPHAAVRQSHPTERSINLFFQDTESRLRPGFKDTRWSRIVTAGETRGLTFCHASQTCAMSGPAILATGKTDGPLFGLRFYIPKAWEGQIHPIVGVPDRECWKK